MFIFIWIIEIIEIIEIEETKDVFLVAVFSYLGDHYNGGYAEIDINSETIIVNAFEGSGAVNSETFSVPLGWNEVTRINIYDNNGNLEYYTKDFSEIGSLNGLVVAVVPFKTKADNTLVTQIFKY